MASQGPPYPQRAFGPTLVVVILFFVFFSALPIALGLYVLVAPLPALPFLAAHRWALGGAAIALGLLDAAVGAGLWALKRWARIAALVILGLSAVGLLFVGLGMLVGVDVGGAWTYLPIPGVIALLLVAVAGWLAWYLLRPDVAVVFASRLPPPPPPPMAIPPPVAGTGQEPGQAASTRPAPAMTERIRVESPSLAWLVMAEGPHAGHMFRLFPDATLIGRDPGCDIVLEDSAVSRQHAKVRVVEGEGKKRTFVLYDLASENGTTVNGEPILKHELRDGDRISIGRTQLTFKQIES